MRNPVGPLPSSIYWRRRAILGAVLVLVALLAVWLVYATGGGGGGKKDGAQGSGSSSGPAPSITPGPSGSGPAISQQPGGRDEAGGSGKDDDATGTPGDGASDGDEGGGSGKDGSGKGGTGDGSDAAEGSNDAGGGGGSGGAGGGAAGAGAGSSDAQRVTAGSSLPDCTTDTAELSLRSAHNTYEPGKKPKLELSVKNASAAACKVDLGAARTVVTITLTGEDDPYWSSKDCPAAESLWLRVPAKETIRYEIEWDRKASRAACAKPPSGSAKPGTYLVEAKAPGLPKARTSFRLDED